MCGVANDDLAELVEGAQKDETFPILTNMP